MSEEVAVAVATPETTPSPEPVQTPTPEPAKPVEQVVTPVDDKSAAKFAALARKKRETEARETALSAREKEINERAAKAERIEQAIANRDKDPLAVLEAMGIDIEQFAEKIATGPMIAEKKSPEAKAVEELRAELKAIKDREEAAVKQKEHDGRVASYNAFVKEVNDFVNKEPAYELIRAQEEHDLVLDVIEAKWNESQGKVLLTHKEAADMVEASLENKQRKGMSTEKIKKMAAELLGVKPTQVTDKQVAAVAAAVEDGDNEFLKAARGQREEAAPDSEIPADVAEWLAAAEPSKKSMYLTNEITSNIPQRQTIDEESDFEKAMKLLK